MDDRARRMRPYTVTKWFLITAIFIGLALGVFFARNVYESRRSYDLGTAAHKAGNPNAAILHYRHALEWYAPIGGASDRALESLMEIGAQQSRLGDLQTSLFAYRSARMGVLAVEHPWSPLAKYLPLLNRRIATLMSAQTPHSSNSSRPFEAELASFEARQRSPVPAFLAALSFLFWLVSLGVLVRYGFDRQGAPCPALKWLVPCSILLLVVFIGLVRIA